MKNLISTCGCVMILLAFLLQFVQNQVLLEQIQEIEAAVSVFCEMEKRDKSKSADNEKKLKESLTVITGCEEGDIMLKRTVEKRGDQERGRYRMEIPIKRILANPAFWGLEKEQNQGCYQIEREIVYE